MGEQPAQEGVEGEKIEENYALQMVVNIGLINPLPTLECLGR